MPDRKELVQGYKLSHRPMGVFQIRNVTNDKVFVDSSLNIPGKINRHRFTLNAGMFKSRSLQDDWNVLGEASFEFETLEPVEPRSDSNYDYAADVQVLEDLWLERLEPYGEVGYNERKLTSEERLAAIRANRKL